MSWRSPRRSWWLIAAGVLLLGACGGDDGAGEATASTVRASVTPTTAGRGPATTPAPTAVTDPPPVATSVPSTAAPATTAAVTPVGFELVAARITAADGSTCDVCLWLADSAARRSQGLMGVTDLGGADGMLFTWPAPSTGAFWMRDTPMPLSIAFFAGDGSFVSAADMTPCLAPTPDAECPRYRAAGAYAAAIEVPLGTLGELGIGPGSRLEVLDAPCPVAAG